MEIASARPQLRSWRQVCLRSGFLLSWERFLLSIKYSHFYDERVSIVPPLVYDLSLSLSLFPCGCACAGERFEKKFPVVTSFLSWQGKREGAAANNWWR